MSPKLKKIAIVSGIVVASAAVIYFAQYAYKKSKIKKDIAQANAQGYSCGSCNPNGIIVCEKGGAKKKINCSTKLNLW
jgi:hypothetical protein